MLPELAEVARARLSADGVPAGDLTSPAARWTASSDSSAPTCAPATRWRSRTRAGPTCSTWSPRWGCARSAYRWTTRAAGRRVAAALAAGARALVVTSRAQNPTGAAVSAARAEALRALLAGRRDLLLIEDDHAAELARVPCIPWRVRPRVGPSSAR
ncbi:hypothetical protein NKG94_24735 [Micromonospora sp. M12]